MTSINVQNKYSSALSAPIVAASGDMTFTCVQGPQYSMGWLVIDELDAVKSETVQYHATAGNDVSVHGINRINPHTHNVGATVRMLTSAEAFNYVYGLICQTFMILKTGGLGITVFGGPVVPGVSASDTNLTMSNGVNYVWYKPSDNSVNVTQSAGDISAGNGSRVATVVAAGGVVTSVSNDRYALPLTRFKDMVDVSVGSITDGQMLAYRASDQKFVPGTLAEAPNDGKPYARKSLGWYAAVEEAPNDANQYARHALGWQIVTPGLPEAPSDGKTYGRKNAAWNEVATIAGAEKTTDLTDVSVTLATDKQALVWDNGLGYYVPRGVAVTDAANAFTGDQQFNGSAIGAYVNPAVSAGAVTVDFTNANFGVIDLTAATAVTIQGMRPGNAYSISVTAFSGASISSLVLKQISGATLARYAPGGAIPDVTSPGQYLLTVFCGGIAANVYSSQKATLIA